jgi:hypothetical protein
MYVLPPDALSAALDINLGTLNEQCAVSVPGPLLRHLLQLAVAAGDFDEQSYLAANPDVAQAIKAGKLRNARLHYVSQGYFEGRRGGHPRVDEAWYLKRNPDVAEAVKAGTVASGSEHFVARGAEELRAPAAKYEKDCQRWAVLLNR